MSDDWRSSWYGDPAELLDVDLHDVRAALIERPAWHVRAACRGMGPAMFYTGHGIDNSDGRAVCASCSVVRECRAAGDVEAFGLWGNTTALQRRSNRTRQRPEAA